LIFFVPAFKIHYEHSAELKYTKDHEWIKIDGDIATVGITDFAQGRLGDIVYVEVETINETLDQEEVLVPLGLLKPYLTYSCRLLARLLNSMKTGDEPELLILILTIDGWMIKMRCDAAQVETLLTADAYKDLVA
jgi:glycine cleavage system H protein